MTERHAERIANLVIGAAVVGGAVYVLKTPEMRRVLLGAARHALFAAVPAWLLAEARRGWADGADRRRPPAI